MLPQFNTAAMEAICSGTYLEHFLNCMEQVPSELSKYVTQLRELDSNIQSLMQDMKIHNEIYSDETADAGRRQKAIMHVQRGLIKSQEYWDEKLQLAAVIIDVIDTKQRQLTQNQENIGIEDDPSVTESKDKEDKPKAKDTKSTKQSDKVFSVIPKTSPTPPRTQDLPAAPAAATPSQSAAKASGTSPIMANSSSPPSAADTKNESQPNKLKRQRRQRTQDVAVKEEEKKEEEAQQPKKKKKRKAKNSNKNFEKTLVGEPIDPDEPTYCLCEQVSYGDMIGCDNDSCVIEWFHFNCVSLTTKPKGKWYCPKCRGDRPNIKRSDLK